eukprot:765770-Hanusia_phi.AAC.1
MEESATDFESPRPESAAAFRWFNPWDQEPFLSQDIPRISDIAPGYADLIDDLSSARQDTQREGRGSPPVYDHARPAVGESARELGLTPTSLVVSCNVQRSSYFDEIIKNLQQEQLRWMNQATFLASELEKTKEENRQLVTEKNDYKTKLEKTLRHVKDYESKYKEYLKRKQKEMKEMKKELKQSQLLQQDAQSLLRLQFDEHRHMLEKYKALESTLQLQKNEIDKYRAAVGKHQVLHVKEESSLNSLDFHLSSPAMASELHAFESALDYRQLSSIIQHSEGKCETEPLANSSILPYLHKLEDGMRKLEETMSSVPPVRLDLTGSQKPPSCSQRQMKLLREKEAYEFKSFDSDFHALLKEFEDSHKLQKIIEQEMISDVEVKLKAAKKNVSEQLGLVSLFDEKIRIMEGQGMRLGLVITQLQQEIVRNDLEKRIRNDRTEMEFKKQINSLLAQNSIIKAENEFIKMRYDKMQTCNDDLGKPKSESDEITLNETQYTKQDDNKTIDNKLQVELSEARRELERLRETERQAEGLEGELAEARRELAEAKRELERLRETERQAE